MNKIITRIGEPFILRGRTYICRNIPATFIHCDRCIFYKANRQLNGVYVSPCGLDAYYSRIVGKCCQTGGVYESYYQ